MSKVDDDFPVTAHHMGDGYVILSQFGEDVGHYERVSGGSAELMGILRPFLSADEAEAQAADLLEHAAAERRQDAAMKNTDRRELVEA